MTNYACKYCGRKGADASFAGGSCNKSASRRHELVAAQNEYACKFCGRTSANPAIAGSSCQKSPTRRCVLVG